MQKNKMRIFPQIAGFCNHWCEICRYSMENNEGGHNEIKRS